jgi:hypothetical protein
MVSPTHVAPRTSLGTMSSLRGTVPEHFYSLKTVPITEHTNSNELTHSLVPYDLERNSYQETVLEP